MLTPNIASNFQSNMSVNIFVTGEPPVALPDFHFDDFTTGLVHDWEETDGTPATNLGGTRLDLPSSTYLQKDLTGLTSIAPGDSIEMRSDASGSGVYDIHIWNGSGWDTVQASITHGEWYAYTVPAGWDGHIAIRKGGNTRSVIYVHTRKAQ